MKHLPNTITLCNLVSGCVATYFALQANYQMALAFIVIGAAFDFLDGFVARLLGVSSVIGKELDSLADDITFGLAPASIVFSMLQSTVHLTATHCGFGPLLTDLLPFTAFLIAAFSGLRLAKFNVDDRQTTSFIGLPTPANALFWGALALGLCESGRLCQTDAAPYLTAALLLGVVLSSWLLVSEIPMFALKFKTFDLMSNVLRYTFILIAAVLLLFLGIKGFAAVIVLYVLVSVANSYFLKGK